MIKNTKLIQIERYLGLGDVLISTVIFPGLKAQGYRIRYLCHPVAGELLEDNPYVDEIIGIEHWSDEEIHKATKDLEQANAFYKIKHSIEDGKPIEISMPHSTTTHCLEAGVPISDELMVYLKDEHLEWGRQFSNSILIHTKAGFSPYKNWPLGRWQSLADLLKKILHMDVYQISPWDPPIPGVLNANSPSIKHSIAALKFCKLFIGLDSFLNHATRAVQKSSLILWGATHPQIHGYIQNTNLINGVIWKSDMENFGPALRCQPCYKRSPVSWTPCPHTIPYPEKIFTDDWHSDRVIQACMHANTVEIVLYHALNMMGL